VKGKARLFSPSEKGMREGARKVLITRAARALD